MTTNRPHLLLVDDEPSIRKPLAAVLGNAGYRVTTAADAAEARAQLQAGAFDLAILDIMMPGEDGLSLARFIRANGDLPIILLTARAEDIDRIVGLEMGADDYLAKPFSARELLARIKAILRRTRSLPPNLQSDSVRQIRFGAWTLDTIHRHLVSATGVVTALSGAEYRLLRIFLQHPQRVLSREQLLDLTQGKDADPLDRSIDVQVSRLRHRLDDDPREPQIIKTVRSEGYVLAAPVGGQ